MSHNGGPYKGKVVIGGAVCHPTSLKRRSVANIIKTVKQSSSSPEGEGLKEFSSIKRGSSTANGNSAPFT